MKAPKKKKSKLNEVADQYSKITKTKKKSNPPIEGSPSEEMNEAQDEAESEEDPSIQNKKPAPKKAPPFTKKK